MIRSSCLFTQEDEREMTTKLGGGAPKCPKCGKSVYHAEQVVGAGKTWHKRCFTCTSCNKSLDSTTVTEHESKVMCPFFFLIIYGITWARFIYSTYDHFNGLIFLLNSNHRSIAKHVTDPTMAPMFLVLQEAVPWRILRTYPVNSAPKKINILQWCLTINFRPKTTGGGSSSGGGGGGFCSSCGAKSGGGRFCSGCGAQV